MVFPLVIFKNISSSQYQHSKQSNIKLSEEICKKICKHCETLVKINLFSLGINWILALFRNTEFMLLVKDANKSFLAVVRTRASWRGTGTRPLLVCGRRFTSLYPEAPFAPAPLRTRALHRLPASWQCGKSCFAYLSLSLPTYKLKVLRWIVLKSVLRLRHV